jgi:hypothetical protein
MNNEPVEQAENKSMNLNPEGKGGFGDNPGNINTNGRPKDGVSITSLLRNKADVLVEVSNKNTGEKKKMARNEAIAELMWVQALQGNWKAIHEILDRLEGKPVQPVDLGGEIPLLLVKYVGDTPELKENNNQIKYVGEPT